MKECDIVAARKEAELLKGLQHENIVRFVDMFESSDGDDRIYIVMELMDGTLYEVLKHRGQFTEREAAKVFECMV